MTTIKDLDIKNKKVIIRCDLNVPIKEDKILDDNRILQSLKTIKYVLKYADKVIILSHLGRIKTREDIKTNSLKIVCDKLSEYLNLNIKFCSYEEDINKAIEDNKIVMLENTRYFDLDNNKESNNDKKLSEYFASFGDIFINDAFAALHREASSTTGIASILPSANGFLVEEEINKLSELFNPDKPFTIIFGGSKVSEKIPLISNLIDKTDNVVIIGAMAFTFLKAKKYDIGSSLYEDEYVKYCLDLLNKYEDKIILPLDIYQADDINGNNKELVDIKNISGMGLDIGPKTIENIKEKVKTSKTIFANGPAGLYENDKFSYGTKELFMYLSNLNSKVIIGGGDSVSAVKKFTDENKFYHISTGGGASLEFLSGKKLPGICGDEDEKI